jgi:hypothetical protein
MNVFTKKWFHAAAIRAIKTFAQAMLATITVGQTFAEVSWANAASVAGVAAVISLLTSLAGLPEVNENDDR